MARLFVSLSQPDNTRIFGESLPQHEILQTPPGELPEALFDLAILDLATFVRLRENLRKRRQAVSPALMPVMVLLQQSQTQRVRDLLGSEIHEIMIRPSSRVELLARIDSLLKLHDLSRQQQVLLNNAEQNQARTERAYRVLAAGNEVVLRGEDEPQLFRSVLETLIRLSDYALAWIGRAEAGNNRAVEVMAWSGDAAGYIRDLQLRWQEDRFSEGPAGLAIKTGMPQICEDVETDARFRPWRDLARKHGFRSSVALPLAFSETELGVLAIYSTRPRTFTDDEVSLLERLAANISFGVETLRMRDRLQEQRALAWNSAYRDALTGLPNRQWVMEELSQLDAEFNRHRRVAAVLFVDLDGFKRINDSLGHEVGDQLLHDVARRLTQIARAEDFVARLGGDEFLILMRFDESDDIISQAEDPNTAVADAAAQLADRLTRAMKQPFQQGALQHHLGASVGISLYPADTTRASDLINYADIAMYEAKSAGSGHFRFYYTELSVRNRHKLTLKNNLHRAVDARAFDAWYQPIIDLRTGEVAYVEALMRLVHPDGTVATPGHFLQALEESGLISRSGQLMIEQACSDLAAWRTRFPDLRLSLNLSVNQLWQPNLVDQLEQGLSEHSLPASALMLEVTEGSMMTDIVKTEQFLEELHGRGFEIAIDDFGTGYSSLSRLRSLPVNKLKVDKSFMHGVPHERKSTEMVRAILQMAASLDLDVVAEGVETENQLQFLSAAQCQFGQGFLFARPMSSADMFSYLNQTGRKYAQAGGPAA